MKLETSLKVRIANHNYLQAKIKSCNYCSRKSCGVSVSPESGYCKPPRTLRLLQHYVKGLPPSCPPPSFPKIECFLESMIMSRHTCCDLRTLVILVHLGIEWGKPSYFLDPGWESPSLLVGNWPYVLGIHQVSCTAQTGEPGSSLWISAHQMKSYGILAFRLMSCLAPGCWAAAFSWYPQIFLIQVS